MTLKEKLNKAEEIIEKEKEDLIEVINSKPDDFAGKKDFIFFYEENAKYKIQELHLPEEYEIKYLKKIVEVYGPFSEDKPSVKSKYYDFDIYKNKKSKK